MQGSSNYFRSSEQTKPKHRVKRFMIKFISIICLALSLALFFQYHFNHKYSNDPNIKLGSSGYCLDDYKDRLGSSALVEAWHCNSSKAQIWSLSGVNIVHDKTYCLDVANDRFTRQRR